LSLGVVLEDFAVVVLALVTGSAGVLLEIVLGSAAVRGIGHLLQPRADGSAMGLEPPTWREPLAPGVSS